jgi:hypothetical protein
MMAIVLQRCDRVALRKFSLVVATCTAGLLALGSAPALADTASVSFTDAAGRSDPAAHVGRTFTVAGNTTVSKHLWIRFRAAGGAPCAPSSSSDSGSNYFDGFSGDSFNGATVNGDFTLKKTGVWSTPGTYMFCIWLADSETTSTTPITQNVTFRAPTGTISATVSPITPQVGQQATVTITGASEGPEGVYATIRAAGAPCATSYAADSGQGLVNGTSVNGAFSVMATTTPDAAGTYLICLWLADSSSSGTPVAGPQPVTFTVAAPPAPCVVPRIAPGTAVKTVVSGLRAAHCTPGKRTYSASRSYRRGSLIRLNPAPGTSLASQAAVGMLISTGKPCRVPTVGGGTRLRTAKARVVAAGCTVGSVRYVKSRTHRRGTVVRYSPKSGTRLKPRARVGIVVSRGRR